MTMTTHAVSCAIKTTTECSCRLAIVTDYDPKPIPIRAFDWAAYRDGYEGPDGDGVGGDPIGWGRTEEEAIADLLELEEARRS